MAQGDPALLSSLIGNLLDNAIPYNLEGGQISIGTRRDGLQTILTVGNTGPNVPGDAIGRILQPFQRLASPATRDGNTGLGLAIVRAIADSHGADLRVLPNPHGGLTVTVTFPAA